MGKYGSLGRGDGAATVVGRFDGVGSSSGTIRCTSAPSPWCRKSARFLTSNRAKSHSLFPPGGASPLAMGDTNCGQSFSHIVRNMGIVLAVGPTSESYTVDTKCGYSLEDVSTGISAGGGSALRMMAIASLRVYGGKLICGTAAAWRNSGRGVELRTKMTDSDGICWCQ